MPSFQDVLIAARELSAADRLRLAESLWENVPLGEWPTPSEQWIAEAQRRSTLYDEGRMSAATWPEVRAPHGARRGWMNEVLGIEDAVKPTVYVKTSVLGHLTSSLQRDVGVAGRQHTTREWWKTAFDRFELFTSRLVLQECADGGQQAAQNRIEALAGLRLLPTTSEAELLAQDFIAGHAVPETEPEDALHIALAAAHGVQFLVTWNCRHIANAVVRPAIERICRSAGYEPPVICTPEELSES